MPNSKVLFVLGAGQNFGAAASKRFTNEGYKVALASRSVESGLTADGTLLLKLDLAKTEQVGPAFEEVKAKLGPPSVVVYNASANINTADPLALPIDAVRDAMNTNILSNYAAAQAGMHMRDSQMPFTYITTGNALSGNVRLPKAMQLGIGKSAASHMIECLSALYVGEGNSIRFYYADERKADGTPMFSGISGPGSAEFYWHLVNSRPAEPLHTFVSGKGSVKF